MRNSGHLAGAAEDREHRLVAADVDGVVAPFAGGDLAAVDGEDGAQFLAVEGGDALRSFRSWACRAAVGRESRPLCAG